MPSLPTTFGIRTLEDGPLANYLEEYREIFDLGVFMLQIVACSQTALLFYMVHQVHLSIAWQGHLSMKIETGSLATGADAYIVCHSLF